MKARLSESRLFCGDFVLTFTAPRTELKTATEGGEWTIIPPNVACRWTEDGDGDWNTECGDIFIVLNGSPTQNKMRFCCYCGKPLKEVRK